MGEYLLDVVAPYELTMALALAEKSTLEKVIFISSMYGVVPFNLNLYDNPLTEAPMQYSVAKAAQIHLTKNMAIRLADKGVQVNSISYGGVEGRVDQAFMERYANLCPSGGMLKEEDIVGAIEFLVSDRAVGLLGHNLVVDGGWSLW